VVGLHLQRLTSSSRQINQSEVKAKPLVTRSLKFSRALRLLHAILFGVFDWLTISSVSFVIINQSKEKGKRKKNYVGFGFTPLN